MTKLNVVLLCLLFACVGTAQNIQFLEKGTDYFKLSQAQNKIIFIDFQAAWCKPCKLMEQTVFKNDTISRFYNQNFINVTLNTDSSEGKAMSKKYGVVFLPTFVFLDANGNLLHRNSSAQDVNTFLALGMTALDSTKRFAGLKKRFLSGYRESAFLKSFAEMAFESGDTMLFKASATAYLHTQKDWLMPENMDFIRKYTKSADFEGFTYILAHQDTFQRRFGKMTLWKLEETFIPNDLSRRFLNLSEPAAKAQLQAQLKPFVNEQMSEKLIHMAIIFQLQAKKQKVALMTAIVEYVEKFQTMNPYTLVNLSWMVYEQSEQPETLQAAIDWSLKAIEISDDATTNEVTAHLFFKKGDNIKAKFYAERAIERAKTNGGDASDAKDLLSQINK
jgi:thiol-disulfide isomerase/thioredoxin